LALPSIKRKSQSGSPFYKRKSHSCITVLAVKHIRNIWALTLAKLRAHLALRLKNSKEQSGSCFHKSKSLSGISIVEANNVMQITEVQKVMQFAAVSQRRN
jgi:hypothetical protein